tara:strand:- start:308 stop:733 length:426 start_codon:yes stop_codon:yes gene_type:complete
MTLNAMFVELLAKQNMSCNEIAYSLHCKPGKIYSCARKHDIEVKKVSGGARIGSGHPVDFKQEWSDWMLLRLFDNDGNPVNRFPGGIQKAFYQEMCWLFEDDDFQRKCKPTTIFWKFKNMKKDVKSGIIKIVVPNDIDWEE